MGLSLRGTVLSEIVSLSTRLRLKIMSRSLDDLSSAFRPLVFELLARCVEAGYMVMIIDTLRTPSEHAANLARGVSWIKHSKHLDGLAIDIAPYDVYTSASGGDKLTWDAAHPLWRKIGVLGETIGLRWGGRWSKPDLGHFEYLGPQTSSV